MQHDVDRLLGGKSGNGKAATLPDDWDWKAI
jgi:hypothetical protein